MYCICTGCAVALCSPLPQASWQSPDYERGTGLLPEKVEVHVGRTTAVAIRADKCQEVTVLRHALKPLLIFARMLEWVRKVCFQSKEAAKRHKRLEDCLEQGPKLKKQTVATKKHAATIVRYPLKANESPPTRLCFARICCPRCLLQILIELRFSSRTANLRLQPYLLWEHCCMLANCGFCSP